MNKSESAFRKPWNQALAALGLGLCLSLTLPGQAMAQNASTGPSISDVEKLENKMFSRQYPNDPPEKRVERLELLVFGATQAGGLDERWARLSQAIKDRQNPESTMPQPKSAESLTAPPKSSAAPPKAGNYPAVDSLEWRVLKKTFRQEPISDRLSRLETKLLGQANPGMALVDRVERLKKIGATVAAGSQPANSANLPPAILGPMPKAVPRGMPFMFGDADDQATPSPFSMRPFSGMDDSSSFGQINRMMSEMMSQMNRQMRDLKNLPPGVYQYKIDPSDPGSSGLSPFKTVPLQPFQPSKPGQATPVPNLIPKKAPTVQDVLPPYADPNSI